LKQARPLHDWVGVWTLIILCALVVSGLALVRPTWVEPALNAVAGPEPEETPPSASCGSGTPVAPVTPLSFDAAIARASTLVPGGKFKSLYPVDFPTFRRWELVMGTNGSDARKDEAHVLVDRQCGDVRLEATPATRSGHETASMWLSDIHDGGAFGPGGPLFVSLIGLTPLVLLWSGILMWLRGRRRSPRPV
jgi:uncharacterized iron-regulated membrane protein